MDQEQTTQDICDAALRADDPYVRAIARYLVSKDPALSAAAEAMAPKPAVEEVPLIVEEPAVTTPETVTPAEDQVEAPAPSVESAEASEPEAPATETPIGRIGLEFSTVQLLMGAGFDSVEELKAELDSGFDLNSIDGITPEIAEAIQAKLK